MYAIFDYIGTFIGFVGGILAGIVFLVKNFIFVGGVILCKGGINYFYVERS